MAAKFSTIVYISIVPLSEKLVSDFYIDILIHSGFTVEFWDVSQIYNKQTINNDRVYEYLRSFTNKAMLNEYVDSYKNWQKTLFVINITYTYQFSYVYRLLKKYDCSTALFARGMIPIGQLKSSKCHLMVKVLNPFRLFRNLQIAYALLLKRRNLTKKIDYIFQAGTEGAKALGIGFKEDLNSAKQNIQINYFDYDNYLESKYINDTSEYIVFLDEYLPFHPDFDLLKMQKVNPLNYFKEINNVFDKIEKETSSRVIIAAHPKANYKINPFNKREIIYGETLGLVKRSKLVLAHTSTSISMAICARKKVVLINSDLFMINNGHISNILMGFSKSLNLRVINMSENRYNLDKIEIDEGKYELYLNSYLTSNDSKNRVTRDIFLEFLSKVSSKS